MTRRRARWYVRDVEVALVLAAADRAAVEHQQRRWIELYREAGQQRPERRGQRRDRGWWPGIESVSRSHAVTPEEGGADGQSGWPE